VSTSWQQWSPAVPAPASTDSSRNWNQWSPGVAVSSWQWHPVAMASSSWQLQWQWAPNESCQWWGTPVVAAPDVAAPVAVAPAVPGPPSSWTPYPPGGASPAAAAPAVPHGPAFSKIKFHRFLATPMIDCCA
jgi:hypothetical protein